MNSNQTKEPALPSVSLTSEIYARLVDEALDHIDPMEPHGSAAIDAYVAVRVDELLRHALRLDEGYDPDF